MKYPPVIARVRAALENPQDLNFESLALEVFAFQFEHNQPYRRLCQGRGLTPDTVGDWRDIPQVPVSAFKHAVLTTAPAAQVFRTSGTTGGPRGEHHLPDVSLYRTSWRRPFQRALVPGGHRVTVVSLIPSEAELPDSSLSWMVARALETYGTPASRTVFTGGRLDTGALAGLLGRAGEPLLILGTTFALADALDELESLAAAFSLPPGTRLMDTGGFKGRRRSVRREDLLEAYRSRLGIPGDHVVGEYGMTELCSQFYEAPGTRLFYGPPWVRTRVLDPVTLDPLPPGKTGLLAHFDLANAWTVAAVVTEDLGVEESGGFRLAGRAQGADLRGCSLTVEDLTRG